MRNPRRPGVHPLLLAALCLVLAVSSVTATEPDPGQAATPAPSPVAAGGEPTAPTAGWPSGEPGGSPAPSPSTPTADDPGTGDPRADPTDAGPGPSPDGGPRAVPDPSPGADAGADPGADAEHGSRVIVVLRSNADVRLATDRARGRGIRVDLTFSRVIRGYAAQLTPGQLRVVRADPQVAAVVPDERFQGLAAQTIPTGISRVFARRSAAARINGVDERVDADVAIFDTGIDGTHPDLNVAGGYNCTTSDPTAWTDENWHGSHVAGTVGALDNDFGVVGVAPGVRLWAVRVLNSDGFGYISWWVCGLDWIARARDPGDASRPLIEVVNMSVKKWGTDDRNCGYTNADLIHQAICRVVAAGIPVVVAAGNDHGPASKRIPAAYDEVITVSALADTDGKPGGLGGNRCYDWGTYDVDDTFADFSNYGPDVDLIAPGKCIWSTSRLGRYTWSSGTSMAAPHVTGAIALYRATRPSSTPTEVLWALRFLASRNWRTATDPDGRPDLLLDVSRIGPLADFVPTVSLPADGLVTNELGATWTLPIALGRQANFIEPVSVSFATLPPQLGGAFATAVPLAGTASDTTVTVTVPPSTPAGRYEVVVRLAYHDLRVHDLHVPVTVENAPPEARAPVTSLVRGSRTSLAAVPVRLAWAAAVDQSPIARYDVGLRDVTGTIATVGATRGTVRTLDRAVPFATARVFGVRATDVASNTGEWALAQPVTVAVIQESSSAVRRSTGWRWYATAYALGGRAGYATRAGAWMRYSFRGSGIALVGARGPTRGSAFVYVDGVRVATISAYSSKAGSRWVLYAAGVDPARSHTLEIRVAGTAGHPRFDVDAFLVLR